MGQAQIPSSCPRVTQERATVNATSRWAGDLLLLFLHFDEGDALVGAAVEAEAMRLAQRAALRALYEVHRWQRIMGASSIATAFGKLTFWMRWHSMTPSIGYSFWFNRAARLAQRGSGSGVQLQLPSFRFCPHVEQRPRQSSRQTGCIGTATNTSWRSTSLKSRM
jgi:hypothetical protein